MFGLVGRCRYFVGQDHHLGAHPGQSREGEHVGVAKADAAVRGAARHRFGAVGAVDADPRVARNGQAEEEGAVSFHGACAVGEIEGPIRRVLHRLDLEPPFRGAAVPFALFVAVIRSAGDAVDGQRIALLGQYDKTHFPFGDYHAVEKVFRLSQTEPGTEQEHGDYEITQLHKVFGGPYEMHTVRIYRRTRRK